MITDRSQKSLHMLWKMRLVDADSTFTVTVDCNVYLVNTRVSPLVWFGSPLFSCPTVNICLRLHHHPLMFPPWQIVFKTKFLPFSCKHSYCIRVHSFSKFSFLVSWPNSWISQCSFICHSCRISIKIGQ